MSTTSLCIGLLNVVLFVMVIVCDANTMFMDRNKREALDGVLGMECTYTNSCTIIDENTFCGSKNICICDSSYHPQKDSNGTSICFPVSAAKDGKGNIWALVSAVGGLITFSALICLALRLYSSGRLTEPRGHYANAGAPSVTLTDTGTGSTSRRTSKASRNSSVSQQGGSRRASYSLLAPPSRTGSRRASTTSLRSQSSFRGHQSSLRGHHSSFREPRRKVSIRRTSSSPVRPRSPYNRRIMSHEVLSLNCEDLKKDPLHFKSEEKLGNHLTVTGNHEV